jgi:HEAT repeats
MNAMISLRRCLSRRSMLAFLVALTLLFGLTMLHPFPRQSLFGPTIRGEPWCVWEDAVRRDLIWEKYQNTLSAKIMRWMGIAHEPMEINELYNHAEMIPLLLHLTEDPDPDIRRRAVNRFYWITQLQDKSALPKLRARLDDTDMHCRIEATMAVATIDPKERVLPVLLQVLDDPDSEHRGEAMRAVTYLACGDDMAFDIMVRHAQDPDVGIRKEIMFELFRHGKKAVPTLLLGLRDEQASVRWDAVNSLGSLGADAKPAVSILERLLNDQEKMVRDAAAEALTAIEPDRYEQLKREGKNK